MTKKRHIQRVLEGRLAEPKPLIQVLIGPRQVGKTTAVKGAMAKRGIYESADYPTPLSPEIIPQWWDQTRRAPSPILAIDEVQKIVGWSEMIKKLWDEEPHRLKVVLTGSSVLAVEKGLRETLAGRFEIIRAPHWSFAEAQKVFGLSLEKFLEFGCYPGAVPFLDDLERWGAYIRDSIVEPAIGRDLLQLHPVENPALLRQVLGVATSLPAQLISLQKILGQLQAKGSIPTIQHYLQLLSQAFLLTGLEKYSPSMFRSRQSSPKLIVHDNALVRCFERPIKGTIAAPRLGYYVENAIGAYLLERGWDVFYWKDRQNEVDLVVMGPQGEKLALEIKSGAWEEKELSGLRKFVSLYPEFEPIVVSAKRFRRKNSVIKNIGIEEALQFA